MLVVRAVSVGLSYIAGIVLAKALGADVSRSPMLLMSMTGLGLSVYMYLKEKRNWQEWPAPAIAAAAILFALPLGYCRTIENVLPPQPGTLGSLLAEAEKWEDLALEGNISAEPDLRGPHKGDVRLRVDRARVGESGSWKPVESADVLLRLYVTGRSDESALAHFDRLLHAEAYGYKIRVQANYRPVARPLNPGEFDFRWYLTQNDAVTWIRCFAERVEILEDSRGNPLMELALDAKVAFIRIYKRTIPAPASRLVSAATLGTRRAVENIDFLGRDLTNTLREAGVGHVLAVSGLHVSIIALLLYSLLRLAGMRPKAIVPVVVFLLLLFTLLTGARPSTMRAALMNTVVLIAFAYFRYNLRSAAFIGLALSATVILALNPMILFSPSFLLSYGAVLSLVLLSPVLNRRLRQLHGFVLIFAVLWFAALLAAAGASVAIVLEPANAIGFAGALWLAVVSGNRLNNRWPAMWKVGVHPLPRTVQWFLAAQLSIQVGMMVPLSSWFFGRFPMAGIFVNLLAIPMVGVIVQLGLLTGLAGLLPFGAGLLAVPLGAAAGLAGYAFIWLAHSGAMLFPYPATPKPTLHWMVGYYSVIGCLLLMDSMGPRIQAAWYRIWPHLSGKKAVAVCSIAAPVALTLVPLLNLPGGTAASLRKVACLSAPQYPVVVAATDNSSAVVVNAGDFRFGERTLFSAIRNMGAVRVSPAIICGTHPRAGNEGLSGLIEKMCVEKCYLPVVSQDADQYLDAVGDEYLQRKAKQGKPWALEYRQAYERLFRTASNRDVELKSLVTGNLVDLQGLEAKVLPLPDTMPERFVSSASARLLEMNTWGFKWLIVTDSTVGVAEDVLKERGGDYNVVVLPTLDYRHSYGRLVDTIVELAGAENVIFSGNRVPSGFDLENWSDARPHIEVFATWRDGAVTGNRTVSGYLVLKAYRTGRTACVRRVTH